MGLGPAELWRMTLAEIREWVEAWNGAHATGPVMSDDERLSIEAMLDAIPQALTG